jgi:hypothetical protein
MTEVFEFNTTQRVAYAKRQPLSSVPIPPTSSDRAYSTITGWALNTRKDCAHDGKKCSSFSHTNNGILGVRGRAMPISRDPLRHLYEVASSSSAFPAMRMFFPLMLASRPLRVAVGMRK